MSTMKGLSTKTTRGSGLEALEAQQIGILLGIAEKLPNSSTYGGG